MQPEVQIVILAAGKGTRMGESDMPKVLHILDGKPLISHLLENLQNLSWDPKPIIVVGFKREQVMEVLGSGYSYAVQEEQLGTGHAVKVALPYVRAKHIVVLYGDMPFISGVNVEKLVRLHLDTHSKLSMFTTTVPNFSGAYSGFEKFGRIIRDSKQSILAIREYKDASPEEQQILELNPGIYIFNTQWLVDSIGKITTENAQREYYLTDMVALAIGSGLNIASLPIEPAEVLGVNTKLELEAAIKFLEK